MKYSVVTSDKLKHNKDLRFEAEFWIQSSSRNGYKGEDIIDFVQYGTSKELNEQSKGFPILRLNEFENCFIMEPQKYCNLIDYNTYCKLKLEKNDVLICRTNGNPNYVGKAAIVTNSVEYAYASYLFKIRPKQKLINASTLTIYLNSKYGRNEINKYSMVGNQSNFSPAKFKEIIIPQLSTKIQEAIEKIVYEADSFNKDSKKIYCQAGELLLRELGILNWQPKHELSYIKNFSDVSTSNRCDAEYFQPKYDEIIKKIKSYSNGWDTVDNIIEINDKNVTPKDNEEYKYIELSNISNNGEITGATIDIGKNLPTRARRFVKAGELIVSSIEGSLNSIALITAEYNKSFCSNGFYVLKSDFYNSETLLCLLKSIIGQMQLKKGCSGTILTAISKEELNKIILPKISNDIQVQIKNNIQKMYELKYQSKQLLEIAKRGIEIAIEENEEVATTWINEQISKIGVKL